MLERCTSTEQAARELTSGPASVWAIVLTLENATISWRELSRHLMVSDPSAFGAFAAELTELPLLAGRQLPALRRALPPRRLATATARM